MHLDISDYRQEILRYGRPECADERDNDGDGRVDYPADPDCREATGATSYLWPEG